MNYINGKPRRYNVSLIDSIVAECNNNGYEVVTQEGVLNDAYMIPGVKVNVRGSKLAILPDEKCTLLIGYKVMNSNQNSLFIQNERDETRVNEFKEAYEIEE